MPFLIYYGKMEKFNENNDRILTDKERDEILHDLFEWEEWDVDSSFLYKWKWAELYEKISLDEEYPFIDMEISCLEKLKNSKDFRKILESTEFITDVWSWDGQKAIALLAWTWWWGIYIAEDYSRQMLNIAEMNIKAKAPHINLWSSQKLNGQCHLSKQCRNNMYLFLWGTICNMTDEEIITELENMDNNWLILWNHILLSYFTAPSTQEEINQLIQIYNSESNRIFHENGMDMLGLSKDDFEFDTIYEKDDPKQTKWPFPWKIKWIIRAKKDTIIKLSDWREIKIEKWQEFTLHYSRRFTKSWIEELFKKSWCKVVFSIDQKWDSIVLLKKKPKKIWDVKGMIRKVLSWLLIASTLTGYMIKDKQLKKAKEIEKAQTEWQINSGNSADLTMYPQETKELIIALQLDEIRDEKVRGAIIDLFNKYVQEHKDESLSTEQLIKWFRNEYGWIIIKNFGVTHSPYDFITPELVSNTEYIQNEISAWNIKENPQNVRVFESNKFDDAFEYNDSWEIYLILKVYIWDSNTPVYLAAKKNSSKWVAIQFSTNTVKEINDKSWLDQSVLSNTDMFGNLITFDVSVYGRLYKNTWSIRIQEDHIRYIDSTVYLIYSKWETYYVAIWTTLSWKDVWLASKTPEWPYTIKTFNEICKDLIDFYSTF